MGKAETECYNFSMMTTLPLPVILHTDREHDKLRTTIVLILILLYFISYRIVQALLNLAMFATVRDYATAISCVLGLVLALGVTAVIEKILKRTWHSGQSLTLDEEGILAQYRHQNPIRIRQNGSMTRINWTFGLKGYRRGGREKRLPAKWVCLACQLQQDDHRLIVYSYMPPREAAVWLNDERHKFRRINQADAIEPTLASKLKMPIRPEVSNEMLRGKDGRYWLAERNRWLDGLELTHEDFAIFMRYLNNMEDFPHV